MVRPMSETTGEGVQERLGFQLYSARRQSLDETLQTVSRLGYDHVEGYAALYADPEGLRRTLDAFGLTMPTAHVGLSELERPEIGLRLADRLGFEVIVCPIIPVERRPTDADGWRQFGEMLEAVAHPYVEHGLTFAYHNHDFEFAPFGDLYAIDLMLETAPSVRIEADLAWMARGDADARSWLRRGGDRIVAIHLKDLAPAGENSNEGGWADFGDGVLPWPELFAAIRRDTKARYFVAEHDNPTDVQRFATRAMRTFAQLAR